MEVGLAGMGACPGGMAVRCDAVVGCVVGAVETGVRVESGAHAEVRDGMEESGASDVDVVYDPSETAGRVGTVVVDDAVGVVGVVGVVVDVVDVAADGSAALAVLAPLAIAEAR